MKKVIYFTLLALLTACYSSDDKLRDKLHQQLQSVSTMTHGYKVLKLDSLTDFEWDKIYFFSTDDSNSFTSEAITHNIGITWHGPDLSYQMHRLLFIKQNSVVDFVDYQNGDYINFSGLDQDVVKNSRWELLNCYDSANFTKAQAKFAVVRQCYEGDDGLVLIPIACLDHFREVIKNTGCENWPAQLARRQAVDDSTKKANDTLHLKASQK